MDEQLVRELVRQAVARHLGGAAGSPPGRSVPATASGHASHALYLQLVNDTDACVIEPAVVCDHCGYCKSHGH